MSLRQRPVSTEPPPPKEDSVPAKEKLAPPVPPKSASSLWILLAAVGISALVFSASNSFITGGSLDYLAPYALCSSDSSKVYTVDAQNSQTQCILIDNGYIANTGTLGVSSEMFGILLVYRVFCRGGQASLENRSRRRFPFRATNPLYTSGIDCCTRPERFVPIQTVLMLSDSCHYLRLSRAPTGVWRQS